MAFVEPPSSYGRLIDNMTSVPFFDLVLARLTREELFSSSRNAAGNAYI
jgi:hypothetical protein